MTRAHRSRNSSYIWWPRRTFPTAEITAARRRSDGGPLSERHRSASDIGATSGHRRSAVGATSERRWTACIFDRRRPAVGPPSERHWSAVGAPSGRRYFRCQECPSRPPYLQPLPLTSAQAVGAANFMARAASGSGSRIWPVHNMTLALALLCFAVCCVVALHCERSNVEEVMKYRTPCIFGRSC